MYKIIVFSLCLIACANANYDLSPEFVQGVLDKLADIGTKCYPQENANENDLKEILSMKPVSRREGKCLLACFNEELGAQDKDGKMNKEGFIKSLEPFKEENENVYNKFIEIMNECFPLVKSRDRCDAADEMENCFNEKLEKAGFEKGLIA